MKSRSIVWMRTSNGGCVLLAAFRSLMITPAEADTIYRIIGKDFGIARRDSYVFVPDEPMNNFWSHWRGIDRGFNTEFKVSNAYYKIGAAICKAIPRLAEDFQRRRDKVPERTVKDASLDAPTIIVHRRRRRNKYGFPRYHWMHGKLTHSSLTYVR